MARNAARKGKLAEQFAQAVGVARDVGVNLAVAAFEIGVGDHPWPAMAGAADIDDVEVGRPDRAIEMGIDEIQPRRGSPMAEQARLDVLGPQLFLQQRIIEQVDLADGQIIGGAPIAVDQIEVVLGCAVFARVCHLHADLALNHRRKTEHRSIRSSIGQR